MKIAAQHVVLVGRRWANPEITVDVTGDGIGVSMTLADFLAAVVEEVGSPATIITQAQLASRLTDASDRVLTGMKSETARVM